jgi:hypothetical protein
MEFGTCSSSMPGELLGGQVQWQSSHVGDDDHRQALMRLAGADLRSSRTTYLHTEADFVAWLRDLGDS